MIDGDSKRLPQFEKNLPPKSSWIKANSTGSISIEKHSNDFCMFCNYVLKVKNNRKEAIKFKIIVEQQVTEQDDDQKQDTFFTGKIYFGRPQPVRLERG